MFKFGKKIVHLGDKSLCTFLCEYPGPLVLYGMGEEGTAAYSLLIKNGIKIAAVADVSPAKQGTNIGEHTIVSFDKLVAKTPKDALIWVTIADKKIAKSVVDGFYDAGFENIINIMLKDPVEVCDFYEFETGLPAVLIGTNSLSERIKNHLEENGVNVVCFCDMDTDAKEFAGLPIKALSDMLQQYTRANVIICEDAQYRRAISQLRKTGVMCNVYRGIIIGIGEFRINKYKHANLALSQALLYVLSYTNAIYYSQEGAATKKIFKRVVQNGLRVTKKAFASGNMSFSDEELFVLYCSMGEEPIVPKNSFYKVESEIAELVHFLATMKELCIDQKVQVQLLEDEAALKVVW